MGKRGLNFRCKLLSLGSRRRCDGHSSRMQFWQEKVPKSVNFDTMDGTEDIGFPSSFNVLNAVNLDKDPGSLRRPKAWNWRSVIFDNRPRTCGTSPLERGKDRLNSVVLASRKPCSDMPQSSDSETDVLKQFGSSKSERTGSRSTVTPLAIDNFLRAVRHPNDDGMPGSRFSSSSKIVRVGATAQIDCGTAVMNFAPCAAYKAPTLSP